MNPGNRKKRGMGMERVVSAGVALITGVGERVVCAGVAFITGLVYGAVSFGLDYGVVGIAMITGVVHGVVSFGLAYGLVGAAIFTTPFGIFLLIGAGINGYMNFLFYDRDTSRISSWLFSGLRGTRFWSKLNGQKKPWWHPRTIGRYLAGWVGLTELEYQLRMQHLAHYLCDDGSENFYSLSGQDGAVIQYLKKAYLDDVVENPMGEALSIHDVDEKKKTAHRTWLAAYLHKLGKGRGMASERETFLALILQVDTLKEKFKEPRHSVWVRQAISFVFFVLAVAMSFGLGLVVMVGLEKAFVAFKLTALVAASGAFTTAGIWLVAPLAAIVFCAMTAQLYVTFNEFWADAYMPGGKTMLQAKFRSWLFGNDPEKKDWAQFAKRCLTLSILGAVVAAAVMITLGYFQSFDSGLTRLFNPSEGAPLLHRSAEFVNRVHIFLKVSLLARLKMVLIMMVRGSLEIIGRLVFAGHMAGLLLRAAVAKVLPKAVTRERDEIEKVANLWRYRRQYARNFALGILTVINAWMNTYWAKATPHIPYTTMCEVGMVQSISLMVRNAMPSWTSTLIGKHIAVFSGRSGGEDVDLALKERLAACHRYLKQCEDGAIEHRTEKFWGFGKHHDRDDLARRALYLLMLLNNGESIIKRCLLDSKKSCEANKAILNERVRVLSHGAIVSLSHLKLLLQDFKPGGVETPEAFMARQVTHLYKALYQRHMVSPGFVKLKNYFRRLNTWTFRKSLIAVGAGGAIWWVYPFLSQGLLPWIPGMAALAPVLPWIFLVSSLIAIVVVAHYILKDTRSKTLRKLQGQTRDDIARPGWRRFAMSAFKILGAGGMLWAFISIAMTFTPLPIIPVVVLTTIVLGMGWTVLAELSKAFGWDKHFPTVMGFVQQSTDFVLKVFGSVAAIWFLWSITQLIPPVAAAVLVSPLLLHGIAAGVAILVGVGVLIGMAFKASRGSKPVPDAGAVVDGSKFGKQEDRALEHQSSSDDTPFFKLVERKITSLETQGSYARVSLDGRGNANRRDILNAIRAKVDALRGDQAMKNSRKDEALYHFLLSASHVQTEDDAGAQSSQASTKVREAGTEDVSVRSSLAGFFAQSNGGSQLKRAVQDVVLFVPDDDQPVVSSAS